MKLSASYLLFDWDGCLAHTLPVWIQSYRDALATYGIKANDADISMKALGDRHASHHFGIMDHEAFNTVLMKYFDHNIEQVELHNEVRETLLSLKALGKQMAIVSSSRKMYIEHVLEREGINHCIDFIFDRLDVTEHKPHPEVVYKAMERFNAAPEDTVIIGDGDKDVGAGKNAGISTILYYPKEHAGIYSQAFITALNPTQTISHFSELLDIFSL